MNVHYFDECKWLDVGDGLIFEYVDAEGSPLAQIALRDSDGQLWRFELFLPPRYQSEGVSPRGLVHTQTAARKVVELILLSTIVTR